MNPKKQSLPEYRNPVVLNAPIHGSTVSTRTATITLPPPYPSTIGSNCEDPLTIQGLANAAPAVFLLGEV